MLHAPTNETKTETAHSKTRLAPLPQRELHPHSPGAAGLYSLGGVGQALHGRSPERQQCQTLAEMQRTYGNQAVLRTMQSSPQVAHMTPLRPSQSVILQRKCACGGTARLTGECAECHKEGEGGEIAPALLQTKLSVSDPWDFYEHEADHVAEQVMRSVSSGSSMVSATPEGGESLMYKVGSGTPTQTTTSAPSIISGVLSSSGGQPLDKATRSFMEPHFGYDFSQVRVHTDARAAESARSVQALAYTVSNHIVFDAGRYAPETRAGKHLLAHELTHVVQQTGTPVASKGLSAPGPVSAGKAPVGISRAPVPASMTLDQFKQVMKQRFGVQDIFLGDKDTQNSNKPEAASLPPIYPWIVQGFEEFERRLGDVPPVGLISLLKTSGDEAGSFMGGHMKIFLQEAIVPTTVPSTRNKSGQRSVPHLVSGGYGVKRVVEHELGHALNEAVRPGNSQVRGLAVPAPDPDILTRYELTVGWYGDKLYDIGVNEVEQAFKAFKKNPQPPEEFYKKFKKYRITKDNWDQSRWKEQPTSDYMVTGSMGSGDDFAEAVMAYVDTPDMLKARSPRRYKFLEDNKQRWLANLRKGQQAPRP